MRLCDRCRVSGCCLDYLGEACKRARERECPDVVYTNADHIRDMSDDELAKVLFDYKECAKNCIMSNGNHCYQICGEESTILKWLQQPYKEELT